MRRFRCLAVASILLLAAPAAFAQQSPQLKTNVMTSGIVTFNVDGMSSATITVTGDWVGTIATKADPDGSGALTPFTIQVQKVGPTGSLTTVNAVDANGTYIFTNAGYLRALLDFTRTSGTLNATLIRGYAVASATSGGGGGGGGGGDLLLGGIAAATGAGSTGLDVLRVDLASDGLAGGALGNIASNTGATGVAINALTESLGDAAPHNNGVIAYGDHPILEARAFNGSAINTPVTAGFGARHTGSLYGVAYEMLCNQDCSLSPIGAHGSAATASLLRSGGEARKTLGTATAAGNDVRLALDPYGRNFVVAPKYTPASSNGTGVTTTTTVQAAPSAGTHLSIHRLWATNTSATPCIIRWRDGAAGTSRYAAYLPQGGVVAPRLDGGWNLTTATRLDLVLSTTCTIEYDVDFETVVD